MNLAGYSDALARLVREAAPGVVTVSGARTVSGSVVAPGQVVTVAHVLPDDEPGVALGGERWTAQVLGRDPLSDLALLAVPGLNGPALAPAPGRLGELVLAVARPAPDRLQVSAGVLSDLGDPARAAPWWGSDARPFPGCSGGLALNAGGGWLGLLSAGVQREQLSLRPAAQVLEVVRQLAASGRVPRGFLGVQTQPVRLPGERRWALAVTATETGSPADGLLRPGDLLVALEGQPLGSVSALLESVRGRPGEPLHFTVLRGGREQGLTLVPQAR